MTIFEAAHVLGCSPAAVGELLELRGLARGSRVTAGLGELEALAVELYRWKAHLEDADSYWVTVSQAAEVLQLSTQRVKQLLDQDRLPYLEHHTGVRLRSDMYNDLVAVLVVPRSVAAGDHRERLFRQADAAQRPQVVVVQ